MVVNVAAAGNVSRMASILVIISFSITGKPRYSGELVAKP